jgi:carbon storage regulator CsrA
MFSICPILTEANPGTGVPMQVIKRKLGERIKIGDAIVTILSSARVKVGVEAPKEIKVERLPPKNAVSGM